MEVSAPYVPGQCNPLYHRPHQMTNPAAEGDRVHWETKGFTDWMNSYLQEGSCPTTIMDLHKDLADGVTLLHFAEKIAFEQLPFAHTRPTIFVHRLENIEVCLSFLDRLGVDMNGLHAEDVASGNVKTILALCRAMYVRFEAQKENKAPSVLNVPNLGDGTEKSAPFLETTQPGSIFTVWYKEDMAVIGWIRRLLGREVKDYTEFADGLLLCALVNQLWTGSITQEEVLCSNPLERLTIATDVAEHLLGVTRQDLDLKAVLDGLGRHTLPLYLLELKAASERLFEECSAALRERERTRMDEEAVDLLGRRLVRQHLKGVGQASPTTPPRRNATPSPPKPSGPKAGSGVSTRSPRREEKGAAGSVGGISGSRDKASWQAERASRPTGGRGGISPAKSPVPGRQSRSSLDAEAQAGPVPGAGLGWTDPMETSLSSLIGAESESPPPLPTSPPPPLRPLTLPPQTQHLTPAPATQPLTSPPPPSRPLMTSPPLPSRPFTSPQQPSRPLTSPQPPSRPLTSPQPPSRPLTSPQPPCRPPTSTPPSQPLTSSRPLTSSPSTRPLTSPPRRSPLRPDISAFFSPFSMPFVPLEGQLAEPPGAKYATPAKNTASGPAASPGGGNNFGRGKLDSWSHKNVKETQKPDEQRREPVSPKRASLRHSATLLARMAARSPGGVVETSSTDSDG